MPDNRHIPNWTGFEKATKADWDAVMAYEEAYNAALPDRILDAIRSLDEDWTHLSDQPPSALPAGGDAHLQGRRGRGNRDRGSGA